MSVFLQLDIYIHKVCSFIPITRYLRESKYFPKHRMNVLEWLLSKVNISEFEKESYMSLHQEYKEIFEREIVQHSKGVIFSFSPLTEKHIYQPYSHAIADDAVERLGELMRRNLLFYSFGEDEIVEAYSMDEFSSLEHAAKYAYKNRLPHRDPKQDGLPSEVLLDLLVQIYNPNAYKLAVRTIFRQNDNNEIKGYDLTYFTKESTSISLWLGQAKLGEKKYCKDGINIDLIHKYTQEYLSKQLFFVCDKRVALSSDAKDIFEIINKLNARTVDDNEKTRAQALINLLNYHRIKVKIPCLLAYDERSVYEECAHLYERVQIEVERIKNHFNRKLYSFIGFSPEIVFYVFPIESIDRLRNKEKGFYAGLC